MIPFLTEKHPFDPCKDRSSPAHLIQRWLENLTFPARLRAEQVGHADHCDQMTSVAKMAPATELDQSCVAEVPGSTEPVAMTEKAHAMEHLVAWMFRLKIANPDHSWLRGRHSAEHRRLMNCQREG